MYITTCVIIARCCQEVCVQFKLDWDVRLAVVVGLVLVAELGLVVRELVAAELVPTVQQLAVPKWAPEPVEQEQEQQPRLQQRALVVVQRIVAVERPLLDYAPLDRQEYYLLLEPGFGLAEDAAVPAGGVAAHTVADSDTVAVDFALELAVRDSIVGVHHDSSFDPGSSRVACLDVLATVIKRNKI